MTHFPSALEMGHDGTYYSTDGSINLECKYRGKSQGSLKWFHGSDEITESEGGNVQITQGNFENDSQTFSLSIKDVSAEKNRGKYSCAWSNDDGDEIKAETDLIVRRARILSDLSFEDQPYKYVEGQTPILELQCQCDGDIAPDSVTWQIGDSQIVFDGQKKKMDRRTFVFCENPEMPEKVPGAAPKPKNTCLAQDAALRWPRCPALPICRELLLGE